MKIIPRKITVLLPKRYLAVYIRDFSFLVLVIVMCVLLTMLVALEKRLQFENHKNEASMKEYKYWKSVSEQFPNVPDILYNASLGAIKVGKNKEAFGYASKAIQLDPLFKKAIELRDQL